MLFKVIEKGTKRVVFVFDVRNDASGYPQFLVYKDREWKYRSAKNYVPFENY